MVSRLKKDLIVIFLVLNFHLGDLFPSLQILSLFQLRIDDIVRQNCFLTEILEFEKNYFFPGQLYENFYTFRETAGFSKNFNIFQKFQNFHEF